MFRHTAYEGCVDLATVADPTERAALEMQVNEFGQCPRVLFKQPHPPRLVCPPPHDPDALLAQPGGDDASGQALSLALVSAILAAAGADEAPLPMEVPALLRQLDVLAGLERGSSSASLTQHAGARGAQALGAGRGRASPLSWRSVMQPCLPRRQRLVQPALQPDSSSGGQGRIGWQPQQQVPARLGQRARSGCGRAARWLGGRGGCRR